jgi:hypothetical protein
MAKYKLFCLLNNKQDTTDHDITYISHIYHFTHHIKIHHIKIHHIKIYGIKYKV